MIIEDKSLKKKHSEKSNSKSEPTASASSSSSWMESSHMSRSRHRRTSAAVLIFLVVCGIVLLSISSSMWIKFWRAKHSYSMYTVQVVNEYPHDPKAFTQGLLYAGNDTLFESTGLYGLSSARKVAVKTGKVEAFQAMEGSYFGEGLTLGERLFQVTWLKKTGFIYDRNSLRKFKEFRHQMKDGWGLATDGKVLFGSDGTSTLYQIDPQTLKVIKKHVKYKGCEVQNLNELEFVDGDVWANVWQTDCIARISHEDAMVLGWIVLPDLREGLVAARHKHGCLKCGRGRKRLKIDFIQGIDVLNGIAWDSKQKGIFGLRIGFKGNLMNPQLMAVTGKLWPKLYEINLQPVKKQGDDGASTDTIIERLCMLDGRL